jgi:hypothetical protein
MWAWLEHLPTGVASFLGSFTGASIGLVALLVGALVNAHLNRRRDDRLQKEDARALAVAIKAELGGILRTLVENARDLRNSPPPADFYVPDLAHSVRVTPQLFSKVGLLTTETIRKVIDAYIIIDQYCEHLIMIGGKIDSTMPAIDDWCGCLQQWQGKLQR